jgi:hypothetical protein
MRSEIFVPPVGDFRLIPESKRADYIKKYQELGPFTKHQYDMDICKLYRQMEDLKPHYKKINGISYEDYLKDIKAILVNDLNRLNLDADFYLNHFYYVVEANNSAYISYLGLFLSMSDIHELIPILEHHLARYPERNPDNEDEEYFLGLLEYQVCGYLRKHKFPEDFFAKHDKIINWIYSKKNMLDYQIKIEAKFDSLISAFNKIAPKTISGEIIKEKQKAFTKNDKVVCVSKDKIDTLFEDIKGYFSEACHEELKKILQGKAELNSMIIFNGQSKQLTDIFRIYHNDENIICSKRELAKWICNHFMYLKDNMSAPANFDIDSTENIIYGQNLPAKANRVILSNLQHPRATYY